jgi:uncharacterized protein (DUF1330 family)
MTVYAVVQLNIHDRPTYERYMSRFMDVFNSFNGKLLVADDHPRVLQGEWSFNRIVIMEFPDRHSFAQWATSPEYQEIAKDRVASSSGVILLAHGAD